MDAKRIVRAVHLQVGILIILSLANCETELIYNGNFTAVIRDHSSNQRIEQNYSGEIRGRLAEYKYRFLINDKCNLFCVAINKEEILTDLRDFPSCNIEMKGEIRQVIFTKTTITDYFSAERESDGNHGLNRRIKVNFLGITVNRYGVGNTISFAFDGFNKTIVQGTKSVCAQTEDVTVHPGLAARNMGITETTKTKCVSYKNEYLPLPSATENFLPLRCHRIR